MMKMKLLTFTVALLALAAVNADQTTDSSLEYGTSSPVVEEILTAATEEPQTEEPQTEEPQTEEPKTEEPQTEEPKTEEPQTEEPQTEEPQTEEPKTEEPQTEEPKTEQPQTEQPQTEEPTTATASEAVTDEATSTTTENPNVPHTECSCQMTTGLLGLSTIPVNELAGAPLTGFKDTDGKCDTETFIACREDCKLLVPTFTHNFDLTAAPFTRRDADEKSLGARICSKIGTQPYFARVGLRAEVRCDVKATDSTPARPNYTSANLVSSKQRLSCVAGLPIVSPF